jgi:uncharacterized protein (PEP-CTERM system associated)
MRPAAPLSLLAAAAALGAGGVHAQDAPAGPARVHELTASAAVSETALVSVRRGQRSEELVTTLTPSVRWSSYAGRLRGSVSYAADLRHYAGDNDARTDKNTLDNRLSASLRGELVDNAVFIDASGTVGQQTASAIGALGSESAFQTGFGRSEVSSFAMSPYAVGSLAGLATYELRYSWAVTDGTDFGISRRTSDGLSLALRSQGAALLGWGLSAGTSRTDFGGRGDNRTDRLTADLALRPDVDWRLGVNAGQERTNVGTLAARSYDTYGASVLWNPSTRTRVDAGFDRRYFGDAHRVAIEYRSPRTVWRYADLRDVNNGNAFGGVGQPVTLFQLYFAQFASIQPDPALREQLVLQYLAAIGRRPDEVLFANVLNAGTTIQRRRDLSAAWVGLRANVTIQAFTNDSRTVVGANTGNEGGTAVAGVQRQRGLNVSASYRLTPQMSVSASGSLSRVPGAGSASGELKSVSTALTHQLGRRTSFGLNARYVVFNSSTDPYREATLTASLSMGF